MIRNVMREMGSKGGKKGGRTRMESLTPDERKQLAKKAAAARWKKAASKKKN